MRWRHLRPDEFDHEKLWLAVGLTAALIGWVILSAGIALPKCVWHEMTGLPCPGCGATRCVRALAVGNFERAAVMNPMAFLGFAFCGLYAVYSAVVLAFRLPRLKLDEAPAWLGPVVRVGVVAAVVANWAWLIIDRR